MTNAHERFMQIIIVGALRFPLTIDGMMELSTTRRPSIPRTRHCGSTTDIGSSTGATPASARSTRPPSASPTTGGSTP